MSANPEESIRKRAEKRVKRRYDFYRDLGTFVVTNGVLWGIYFLSSGFRFNGIPWPLWVTFFWGMHIVSEGMKVLQDSGFMEQMRERDFEREVQRERARLYQQEYEKPKRSDVSLGDDGELIYEDEDEVSAKRRHTAAR
jgi:hypothetical protein